MLIAPKKQEVIHYQLVIALALTVAILAGYTAYYRHQSTQSRISPDQTPAAAGSDSRAEPPVLDIDQMGRVEDVRLLAPRNILFTYVHYRAKSVSLTGSFKRDQPMAMQKEKLGVWRASVPLQPGRYTYNYLVDGKKITDPYNAKSENGASVILIEPNP